MQNQTQITLADLIKMRIDLQAIDQPSEELTKGITHLDNHIAKIITSFQLNPPTTQDPT